jgi:hypothetical protein
VRHFLEKKVNKDLKDFLKENAGQVADTAKLFEPEEEPGSGDLYPESHKKESDLRGTNKSIAE